MAAQRMYKSSHKINTPKIVEKLANKTAISNVPRKPTKIWKISRALSEFELKFEIFEIM